MSSPDPARDEAIDAAIDMMRAEGGDCELQACVGEPLCDGTPRPCPWCERYYVAPDGRVTLMSAATHA